MGLFPPLEPRKGLVLGISNHWFLEHLVLWGSG
jgi:hypothetical protein